MIFFLENEKPETKQKRLEAQFANLQIVSNVEKLGTAKVNSIIHYPLFIIHYLLSIINYLLSMVH